MIAGPARGALIAAGPAAGDQSVGELGIVVAHDLFEPGPVVMRVLVERLNQSLGQGVAYLAGGPRAAESLQVEANPQNGRSPGSWGRGIDDRG